MRKRGTSSTKSVWYLTLGIVAVAVAVIVAAGAWVARSAHREWSRLDSAAEEFKVPTSFTPANRVRQGTAFCWVSCTNGGEAIVTQVFKTEATDPQEACRALQPALVDLVGDDVRRLNDADGTCGWAGDLGGSTTVVAVAGPRSAFDAASGYRWREKVKPPDSPVVAFVEFNSGVE